jgi:rare lipoprotein A
MTTFSVTLRFRSALARRFGTTVRFRCLLVVLTAALLSSACGGRRAAVSAPRTPPPVSGQGTAEAAPGAAETGYASWYGEPYHGRRAANGEVYDMHKMTAAHRTLPFETMVKVTNLENQRTTTVRITDRGPFVKGRIIDLSLAAAEQIALVGPGTALVRLDILSDQAPPVATRYAVQVGAFTERPAAERLQQDLAARYGGAYVETFDSDQGRFFRVRVGPRTTLIDAKQLARQLESESLPGFIVRLDN